MTQTLTIRKPDDLHLHLRDGDMLRAVAPITAAHFARATIMPNLVPPVVTGDDAARYHERIMAALPAGTAFEPLMTLYLTEDSDADDVAAAAQSGLIKAVKLYPAGATTNSASGVRDFDKIRPVLERMAEIGLPLCVHGEVTNHQVDIFDREAVFIDTVLDPLRQTVSGLRVIMEHVTTKDGIDYIASGQGIAGTLTVHHLLLNRNAMLAGGIRPHYYCLPIIKRETHRRALMAAATSGDPRYFLGTDSAPHVDGAKESACGCAGCFTALNAMACLAQAFENEDALDRLEDFVAGFGADFYRMSRNQTTIDLVRSDSPVSWPEKLVVGDEHVTIFDPQMDVFWSVAD